MTLAVGDDDEPLSAALVAMSPPYSSFSGFLRQCDAMRDQGLPAKLDRSYFGNQSGGLISQTRKTLAFFELIDGEYRPTERLRQLAEATDDERKAMLRALAEERYTDEIELGRSSGTAGQLLEILRQRGLSGATGRKAATFYIHLAEYTGLPVSPYFAQARNSPSANGSGQRRPRRRKPEAPVAPATPPPAATPETSREIQQAKYIEMLMSMAEKSGEAGKPASDLLNRIERMLGHTPPPQPSEPSEGGEEDKTSP